MRLILFYAPAATQTQVTYELPRIFLKAKRPKKMQTFYAVNILRENMDTELRRAAKGFSLEHSPLLYGLTIPESQ